MSFGSWFQNMRRRSLSLEASSLSLIWNSLLLSFDYDSTRRPPSDCISSDSCTNSAYIGCYGFEFVECSKVKVVSISKSYWSYRAGRVIRGTQSLLGQAGCCEAATGIRYGFVMIPRLFLLRKSFVLSELCGRGVRGGNRYVRYLDSLGLSYQVDQRRKKSEIDLEWRIRSSVIVGQESSVWSLFLIS